jgi:hypothetical protein
MALDDVERRRFLGVLGALGVTGIAGCSGDDGDGGTTDEPTESTTDTATDSPTPDTTTADESTPTSTPTESTPGTPTTPSGGTEFVSLYDGDPLDDAYWHQKNGQASYEARDGGVIAGISSSSGGNSFLCSYEMFDEFELRLELNVDPTGINSGIQFQSNTSQSKQDVHGPQVEVELTGSVIDNVHIPPGESGYIYGEGLGTSWMSDKEAHDTYNNGEWNEFRTVVQDRRVQTFVNGTQIEDLDLTPWVDNQHMIPMGVFGLQLHQIGVDGKEVRWRNIEVKELDAEEWTLLFNGENTDGWTNPTGAGTVTAGDGILEMSSDETQYLLTEEEYDNFVFETWVKADTEGAIRFRNPGAQSISGYGVDIVPSEDGNTGSLFEGSSNYLEDISGQSFAQEAFHPDQWNYVRVAASGENLRVWVNGVTTAWVTDGTHSSGRLVLQHNGGGGTLQFRDMEYKPLDGADWMSPP